MMEFLTGALLFTVGFCCGMAFISAFVLAGGSDRQ